MSAFRCGSGARIGAIDNGTASDWRVDDGASAVATELEDGEKGKPGELNNTGSPTYLFVASLQARRTRSTMIGLGAMMYSTGQNLVARQTASV